MITTPPYENRIHLFHHSDGKLWTFNNILDAGKHINWIESIGIIGDHFIITNKACTPPVYHACDLILRDDYSEIITKWQLYNEFNKLYKRKKKNYNVFYNYHRGSKPKHCNWLRHPKTTNERRQAYDNYDAYNEYGVIIRPRSSRNNANIPEVYDDQIRQDIRNWKRTRSHQWQ